MAENNSPQILLMYTTAALLFILPRLTTHLNIRPKPTLLITSTTVASFFATVTYLAMDAIYTFTWILLKLLEFLLRFIIPDLSISNVIGVARSPGTKGPRQWWEVGFAVMVGVGVMAHKIKYRGGGWTSSLHKIEAERALREDGGEKEEYGGWVIVYASFAFLYTVTLLDSREWFERWWAVDDDYEGVKAKQRQTGREATWELWSFAVALGVAGIVASIQWIWERRERKVRVARREFLDVQGPFVEVTGKEGSTQRF